MAGDFVGGDFKYILRYRDMMESDMTFVECCKVMRCIPVNQSLEVLLPDGRVHFTLPARKKS